MGDFEKIAFFHFVTYFHSAPPNLAVFTCFWPVFAIRNDHQHHICIGHEYGSIVICAFFGVLHFLPFLTIFRHFWHFGVSVGVGRVLGVLLSYKVTRGIELVVGRVNDWV